MSGNSQTFLVSGKTAPAVLLNGTYTLLCSSWSLGDIANGCQPYHPFVGSVEWQPNYNIGAGLMYNGAYTGNVSGGNGAFYTTTVSSLTVSGEWIQITLPCNVLLSEYGFVSTTGTSNDNRYPKTWVVAGSTNGTTWTKVDSQNLTTNPTATDSGKVLHTWVISPVPTVNYTYYRFIFQSLFGGVIVNLDQIKMIGITS